jgi:probable rRNA maturation factor
VAQSCLVRNRQRGVAVDLALIRAILERALPVCRTASRSPDSPLNCLDRIEATIISNRAIARVHREFFDDPRPTDVITFPCGEILIGAGVVLENAKRFGHSPTAEAALCVIHGLLHLADWDDQRVEDAKLMARKQEQIFKTAHRMVCCATHEKD